ncbi:hypothetical protein VNI00_014650 [Paramarasmius palmivorus]|uniref:Thioesterase domain-containing protein n=1 Tax=Paramarasmius palmivorus TaxID=297713 RepID=A0AAW0BRW6_9AGAR
MSNSPQTLENVAGNAPEMIKQVILNAIVSPKLLGKTFASSVLRKMVLLEVSINKMVEEPMKEEGRVVFGLIVDEEMMNLADSLHGGCIAFLIDFCSSVALVALRTKQAGPSNVVSVSQAMNVVYHSPAPLGDRLRIVNTTISAGARASSARTEIWSDTNHRLVASGVHIKMDPSPVKL